jgi:hypothetical protein
MAAARPSELRHKSSPGGRRPVSTRAGSRLNLGSRHEEITMKSERPETNAELNQTFEPLRLAFAITALLLGLVASLHF